MGQIESEYQNEETFEAAGETFEIACHNLELLVRCQYNDECRIEWKIYQDPKDQLRKRRLVVTAGQGKCYPVHSFANQNNKIQLATVHLP